MSNFNQYFKNTGAKTIVDRFFKDIDSWSDVKITHWKYYIEQDQEKPASYYIENKLTATHKVIIEYATSDDPNTVKKTEFEVPREIEGVFIIEGAYRISTNKLGPDYDCRINVTGSGKYIVKFDFERQFLINERILEIKRTNFDLGIAERAIKIPYDEISSALSDPIKENLLKLSERQGKKFAIKLDLPYIPTHITTQLLDECLAFGDDRLQDLIIDKKIESVPSGFMQYIFRSNNGKNYFSARKRIKSHFFKFGQFAETITPITSMSIRYWKGSADSDSKEVQVPPGVNSMNLDSLSAKIQVPKSIAFNNTFTDLIDTADTPINGNTNIQNALTVSCHVTDTQVLFDVYSPDFEKITIDYLDYLNSKVCASEFVDYETNTIKPDINGQVEVKYRMKRRMVPASEIQLIDLHPDFRLSGITRRIPFVNYTDSVRISMGTSMLKQSIPIINAERSLVDTGNYEELRDSSMNEKFNYPEGKVKSITDDEVIITLNDGTDVEIPRRTALQSVNDVAVYTEPKVKVGQKIKEGDVVTGPVGHERDTYKAGVNTLVLYHAYHGLVNEDALVISKSYAERIASYSIIDLMIDVKNTAALKWLAPIGTRVKSKDSVVTLYKAVRLNEVNRALNEKLGNLFGEGDAISEYTVEGSLTVPNNIDDAVVSDILIQENKSRIPSTVKVPDLTFTKTSETVIEEYEKNKDRSVIYKKYPEYVASDTLDPINLDDKNYKVVYTVRVRLIKYSPGIIGEKITNRYGGKGVVSKIVNDEDMPIVVGSDGKQKRVEVVMNPYSTVNRKIPSVIMETSLGLIAYKLRDMVEDLKRTKTGQKKIMPLMSKYYPGRYDAMSVEEFIKLHDSSKIEEVYYFNVGSFSSFTPDKINSWLDELGVETQSTILMPEKELVDLKELEEVLDPEEYKATLSNMTGKFGKVDKPLMAGYMTLERLYHIPSYSNKVTTSLFGVDVSAKRDEPILGRGRYRATGQSIGEMELAGLLSRNVDQFLSGIRENTAQEDNQKFLNNLLGLGLTITDSKGYNQGGSHLKDKLSKMKTKFRIKNNK